MRIFYTNIKQGDNNNHLRYTKWKINCTINIYTNKRGLRSWREFRSKEAAVIIEFETVVLHVTREI